MNGGIIGGTIDRHGRGLLGPESVRLRREFGNQFLFKPQATTGITCEGGAVSVSTSRVFGLASIAWSKTNTSWHYSLIKGSLNCPTVDITGKRLRVVAYIGAALAGLTSGKFLFGLGHGTTNWFGKEWPLSGLSAGWHNLDFLASDLTAMEGAPSLSNIRYFKIFINSLSPVTTTFAAGAVLFDSLLWL